MRQRLQFNIFLTTCNYDDTQADQNDPMMLSSKHLVCHRPAANKYSFINNAAVMLFHSTYSIYTDAPTTPVQYILNKMQLGMPYYAVYPSPCHSKGLAAN